MERRSRRAAGALPPYPEPGDRDELFLVLGERHQPLEPIPAVYPQWLSVPERGLYTGTIAVGAIGSGKTRGLILPAMHQLFGYRPGDAEEKLSGIVLEVKGDLCRHLSRILRECGREADYIDISLGSDIRYNPLNNDLDPYAQATSPPLPRRSGVKGAGAAQIAAHQTRHDKLPPSRTRKCRECIKRWPPDLEINLSR